MMQEPGLTETIPLVCISAILSQYPEFFYILSSSVPSVVGGCSLMALRSQVSFSVVALGGWNHR